MHSYIIVGSNRIPEKKDLDLIIGKTYQKIMEFPFSKISDVRDLQSFLKLGSENCIILLKNANNATEEAQNAFLKHLEEPQKNIIFILTAKSLFGFLPTIISRCEIIKNVDKNEVDYDELIKFLDMKLGEKIAYVDKIKKREDAIDFCEKLILFLHKNMIETKGKRKFKDNLISAQKTLNNIKGNGNVMLQLANLAVKL